MADRLLYLPLAGLCLAAGDLLAMAWGRAQGPRWRGVVGAVAVLAVVALGLRTTARNPIWKTNLVLARQTALDAPRSARALSRYAAVWARNDSTAAALEQAVELAERAVALVAGIERSQGDWHRVILANLLARWAQRLPSGSDARGDALVRAQTILEQVIAAEAQPSPRRARWEAEQRWRQRKGLPVRRRYGRWRAHRDLGATHQIQGAHETALAHFERARQIDPEQSDIHASAAWSHAALGQLDRAERAWTAAVDLNPNRRPHWLELGKLRLRLGRHAQALDATDRARALGESAAADHLITHIYAAWADQAVRCGDWERAQQIATWAQDRHRVRIELPEQ
jgi:tetratricopeptide (TPR) repeat protein